MGAFGRSDFRAPGSYAWGWLNICPSNGDLEMTAEPASQSRFTVIGNKLPSELFLFDPLEFQLPASNIACRQAPTRA
jgi:hypothetical protein